MITQTFDYGWGPELGTKRLETEILDRYLRPFQQDSVPTVIINNTWYVDDSHKITVSALRSIKPGRIVLVSMIDVATVRPDRFTEFDCDVRCVGYYPGDDEIDFWALAVDRWFQRPDIDLADATGIDSPFICLNRKSHQHRQELYDALVSTELVGLGIVSMGARTPGGPPQRSLPHDIILSGPALAPNPGTEQTGIVNDIMSLGYLDNWRRSFLDIVTETWFDISRAGFVSEKIYKPIIGLRPFLVYASDGAVPWLRQRKFEPYVADFGDITDLDLAQPENIVPFLRILCDQPRSYWQAKLVALKDKMLYNRNRFDLYVQEIQDKINRGIRCQI